MLKKIDFLSNLLKIKSNTIDANFCYEVTKEIKFNQSNLIQCSDLNPSKAISFLISSYAFMNNFNCVIFSSDPKYFIELFNSYLFEVLQLNDLENEAIDIRSNNVQITIKFGGKTNVISFFKKTSNSVDKLKGESLSFIYVDNLDFNNKVEVKNLSLLTNEISLSLKQDGCFIVTTNNKEEIIDTAFEKRKDLFKLIKIK